MGIDSKCGWPAAMHCVNVTSVLAGEYIRFEEVADALSDVYFGPVRLGRFHDRLLKIGDSLGEFR